MFRVTKNFGNASKITCTSQVGFFVFFNLSQTSEWYLGLETFHRQQEGHGFPAPREVLPGREQRPRPQPRDCVDPCDAGNARVWNKAGAATASHGTSGREKRAHIRRRVSVPRTVETRAAGKRGRAGSEPHGL